MFEAVRRQYASQRRVTLDDTYVIPVSTLTCGFALAAGKGDART
jgi:uncharacterized spore protein YtfJ